MVRIFSHFPHFSQHFSTRMAFVTVKRNHHRMGFTSTKL